MKTLIIIVLLFVVYNCLADEPGELSASPYALDSTSNPYGRYGSEFSPDSVNNPYGGGSPYGGDSFHGAGALMMQVARTTLTVKVGRSLKANRLTLENETERHNKKAATVNQ